MKTALQEVKTRNAYTIVITDTKYALHAIEGKKLL